MKKTLSIFLSVVLFLLSLSTLAACDNSSSSLNGSNEKNSTSTEAPTEAPTDAPTETPKPVDVVLTVDNIEDYLIIEGNISDCTLPTQNNRGETKDYGYANYNLSISPLANGEFKNLKIEFKLIVTHEKSYNSWYFPELEEENRDTDNLSIRAYTVGEVKIPFSGTMEKTYNMNGFMSSMLGQRYTAQPNVDFEIVSVSGTFIPN